eukprot:EC096250.1.p3 GENE.EC096250.1~~EC096250.1.p3  ORF type:complete len:128 (-),score=2.51 EC096250.1:211-594(-)
MILTLLITIIIFVTRIHVSHFIYNVQVNPFQIQNIDQVCKDHCHRHCLQSLKNADNIDCPPSDIIFHCIKITNKIQQQRVNTRITAQTIFDFTIYWYLIDTKLLILQYQFRNILQSFCCEGDKNQIL